MIAKSGNNTINIITIIASFGVIVGALALFIILSGFSGFKTFTNSMLNDSDPDIKVTTTKGKSFFYTDSIASIVSKTAGVQSVATSIEERVFLQYKQKEQIAYIKGVSANYTKITPIDSTLIVGQWLDSEYVNSAVIGSGISDKLSLGVLNFGALLEVKAPKSGTGLMLSKSSSFSSVATQIVGVYSGAEEFANTYVFVGLSLAQKLLSYQENEISSLEIKLTDDVEHNVVAETLQQYLGADFKVETRIQLNALTYKVLNTEELVSYLIFTLIIIIALFNVIGAIIMMIIDKKNNLKTLFSLGVTIKEIKRIFVYQGFLLTLFGLSVGLILGVLLIFLQQKFQLFMITPSIPYPVELRFLNVLVVAFTIAILGYIAAKIASSRISIAFIER
ncbi:MAG: ABC transporter permease [Polaribacter sp.]|nr:ABC transporter permease [Polaribacter sp.]